ncbi:peptidyl-prolyl cis-trans isomerase FKBP2 [Chironomus tepperi]|uniref:peptidyl-prolyl cis-trans isomerase FKBP2 n=1 Tax=Chironomus tepperi TaxID=113505 RepID=UPI00391F9F9C
MKIYSLISIFLMLEAFNWIECNDKPDNKLKIGIKKRVENCEQKSRKGDLLHVNYTGSLTDGTVFDSSEGRNPLTFSLGSGQVIVGWERGLLGMCVGEIRKLQIPPELGYGNAAMGKIPKNSVLIFEVELVKIEKKKDDL